jgi:predicted ATPase
MYVRKISIKNLRSIRDFHWDLSASDTKLPGWHILIGDNGSGKSTVLRAISLALIGPNQGLRLNPRWNEWLREGEETASVEMSVSYNKRFDAYTGGGQPYRGDIDVELNWMRSDTRIEFSEFASYPVKKEGRAAVFKPKRDSMVNRANNYVWGSNRGWFSAAYGPFRRFTGSDGQTQSLVYNREKVSAHASIFYESIALSNYREWLKNLDYISTKGNEQQREDASRLLKRLKDFINQKGFLPNNTTLEAIEPGLTGSDVRIVFVDGNKRQVDIEQLGDGYRSILSMTLELIRQMTLQYDTNHIFDEDDPTKITAPGVVLIDEIDAHLHPEWQRNIGRWFTDHFPNIQFIVTTHSPLVCQAAVKGSIWRLPAPGSDEDGYQVTPDTEEWKRLVYGNILEAYSTDLFGENIDRSPEAQEKFERVAELSAKEMDEPLTSGEERELETLMDELPETPYKRVTEVEE